MKLDGLSFKPDFLIFGEESNTVLCANRGGYFIKRLDVSASPAKFVKLSNLHTSGYFYAQGFYVLKTDGILHLINTHSSNFPAIKCTKLERGSFDVDGYIESDPEPLVYIGVLDDKMAFFGPAYNYLLIDGEFTQGGVDWSERFEVLYVHPNQKCGIVVAREEEDYIYGICRYDPIEKSFDVSSMVFLKTTLDVDLTCDYGTDWRGVNENIIVCWDFDFSVKTSCIEIFDWNGEVLQERINILEYIDFTPSEACKYEFYVFGRLIVFQFHSRAPNGGVNRSFLCWNPFEKRVMWSCDLDSALVSIERCAKNGGYISFCQDLKDEGYSLLVLSVSSGKNILEIPIGSSNTYLSNGALFFYGTEFNEDSINYVLLSDLDS